MLEEIPGFGDPIIQKDHLILVTGATGFIGQRVLERLMECGYRNLRCLVLSTVDPEPLIKVADRHEGVELEVYRGSLESEQDCLEAVKGARLVFHLAGGVAKPLELMQGEVAGTTGNLLEAVAHEKGVRRFVNVSSFTVYSTRNLRRGAVLDETCEVYERPELKGEAYCITKVREEEMVHRCHERYGVPFVTVRPGYVYGPGSTQLSGRIGMVKAKRLFHLGDSNVIPFVYVDNCADAIVLAGLKKGVDNRVYNIVDDDLPTSSEFVRQYNKNVRPMETWNVPRIGSYLICLFCSLASRLSGGRFCSTFNLYRWSDNWKGHRYSSGKIKEELGWKQRVPFNEGVERYFEYCRKHP